MAKFSNSIFNLDIVLPFGPAEKLLSFLIYKILILRGSQLSLKFPQSFGLRSSKLSLSLSNKLCIIEMGLAASRAGAG